MSHPSAPARRFEELEAYRGLAAVGILVFHVYQYAGQAVSASSALPDTPPMQRLFSGLHLSGVFFVLSAFLLFLPFARAALFQHEPPSPRAFLIRRLIRLLPLYVLAVLVVWAWRFTGSPGQILDLLLHLSFTQTFHQTYIFWTIGPAWSLAVEMHFYLLLAGLAPFAHRLCGALSTPGRRQALLACLLAALALLSVGYKWWAFSSPSVGPAHYPAFYSLPAKLDAFALGMLLALAVAGRGASGPVLGAPAAWLARLAGLALIGGAIMLDTASAVVHLYYSTIVGAGAALLIASTTLGPRGSAWERGLRLPPLRHLGTVSYGIFLLHEPIMIELGKAGVLIGAGPAAFVPNVLILIALSAGAATLSYHLVERPCNELRHLFDRRGRLVQRYSEPGSPARAEAR